MKREIKSGDTNRLTKVLNDHATKREDRNAYQKHADKDTVPFLSYDGEGITIEGKHSYVLLASSNGESLYRPAGISTNDALNFLLRSGNTRRIRIWYSFGYDIQQILKDLSDDQLIKIMHGQPTRYRNFTLQYLPGKIFTVNNVKFYDVFGFWHKSFIKAVQETLGKDAVSQELIKGKESRSDFANWQLDDILRYTNEELRLLVELAEHLRSVLLRADIHLGSAFYGPGSIANYWFKKHQIAPPEILDPVIVEVMERAYYGGRFETFQLGRVEPVYEFDINSAYPAIISKLPYLDGWKHTDDKRFGGFEFSVWHIEWHLPESTKIGPFPSRDKHGLISYPANGRGWYWSPEVNAALSLYGSSGIKILEGYIPNVSYGRPFEWVEELYNRRLELKESGDPAQWAFKVGLNSIYGKTAQRVGSAKYFSLAWAGFITSATRAKLLSAVNGREDSVVAFATDAVYFNRRPGSFQTGRNLGAFTGKRWVRGYFLQSGVYRLEDKNGHKDAYRGFSVKNGIQNLLDQIREKPYRHPAIYQTKFVSHLEAIRCPKTLGQYRLCFITIRKKLQPFRTTKRRVSDTSVWNIVEDPDWISDTFLDELIAERGADLVYSNPPTWNVYKPLLTRSVNSEILNNHNDHSDILHLDPGEFEESYPFARITDRNNDIAFHAVDEVAVERLGGASGIVSLEQVGRLPIVDEDEIIKELST